LKIVTLLLASLMCLPFAGCKFRPTGGQTSSAKSLGDFNPESFNSGNTFEELVNPGLTKTSEQQQEVLEKDAKVWLSDLDSFSEKFEQNDFTAMQNKFSEAEINTHNESLIKQLQRNIPIATGFTLEQATAVYNLLAETEQIKNNRKYDPKRFIGFCFGRALITHTIVRQSFEISGETRSSKMSVPVRKVWVTGPMSKWKHHVATLILADDPNVGFWAIDTYVGRTVSIFDWMKRIQSDFPTAKALFNVTRANRFSEANSLRYHEVLLDDPFFNGFFRDFLKQNVPLIAKKQIFDLSKGQTASLTSPSQDVKTDINAFGGQIPDRLSGRSDPNQ
jgi:hypothetical protein